MSDTPLTDEASFSTVYQGELVKASFARDLERQRDAYAETLREIAAMDPDWTVIAIRHPELAEGK